MNGFAGPDRSDGSPYRVQLGWRRLTTVLEGEVCFQGPFGITALTPHPHRSHCKGAPGRVGPAPAPHRCRRAPWRRRAQRSSPPKTVAKVRRSRGRGGGHGHGGRRASSAPWCPTEQVKDEATVAVRPSHGGHRRLLRQVGQALLTTSRGQFCARQYDHQRSFCPGRRESSTFFSRPCRPTVPSFLDLQSTAPSKIRQSGRYADRGDTPGDPVGRYRRVLIHQRRLRARRSRSTSCCGQIEIGRANVPGSDVWSERRRKAQIPHVWNFSAHSYIPLRRPFPCMLAAVASATLTGAVGRSVLGRGPRLERSARLHHRRPA